MRQSRLSSPQNKNNTCACVCGAGKFTAGKPGDEGYAASGAIDPKDPNYDDEEDENIVLVCV